MGLRIQEIVLDEFFLGLILAKPVDQLKEIAFFTMEDFELQPRMTMISF